MKQLLFSVTKKDFDITWFSGTGAGGQYRNKHQNCCRITHPESGAMGTGQSERSRPANQKEAFLNLTESKIFKHWLQKKIAEVNGELAEIEAKVEKEMDEKNLLTEFHDFDGKWVKASYE
jgi:peptide chain release factor 1